jgi:hypothetical protein
MQPETTAPIAVPQWATDDVVNFILDAKAESTIPDGPSPSSKPQQVDINQQQVVQSTQAQQVPDQRIIDQRATEEKLRKEIESQKKFDEEAEMLLRELESDIVKEEPVKEQPTKEDIKDKKDEKSTTNEVLWRISQLSIEEQEEFIMFVDELQKSHADLSAKQIEKDHKISDLEYENQLLRDSSKKYIEKSYSLEQDEMRNKIPEWISELVTSFKDFDSKKDDFTRKSYRKELIRAAEKEFKRSLNDYIWDSYIWSNDIISWQESFDMNLPKPSQIAEKQNEKVKLDYMSELF